MYIPTFNLCMSLVNREQEFVKGSFYLAQEFDLGIAGEGDYLGQLKAWDPVTQKQVWGIKEDLPFLSGVLSTAGGLVFYGNAHGVVKGVDANSGEVLWSFNAGSVVNQGGDLRGRRQAVSGRCLGPAGRPTIALPRDRRRVIAATPPGGNVSSSNWAADRPPG